MTAEEFATRLESYLTEQGLVSINQYPKGETDNGALFSYEAVIVLRALQAREGVTNRAAVAMEARLIRAIRDLELPDWPGVFARAVTNTAHDSMDNGIAVMMTGADVAARVLEHGRTIRATGVSKDQHAESSRKLMPLAWILGLGRVRWFWNCENPTEFTSMGWHGKSPGQMAFLRTAAGHRVWPWRGFWMAVQLFFDHFRDRGNTDARKLPFVAWQLVKNRSWFWRLLYKIWCWKLRRDYPNGMADVYAIYYREPGHPMAALDFDPSWY
jgi:hypothetical protein